MSSVVCQRASYAVEMSPAMLSEIISARPHLLLLAVRPVPVPCRVRTDEISTDLPALGKLPPQVEVPKEVISRVPQPGLRWATAAETARVPCIEPRAACVVTPTSTAMFQRRVAVQPYARRQRNQQRCLHGEQR